MLLPIRNKLIYPAGIAPGFDPSHIAAQGITQGLGFSGIASAGGFINLLNAIAGNIIGTPPVAKIQGVIGPNNNSAVGGYSWTGYTTNINSSVGVTTAAIFTITATMGIGVIFNASTAGGSGIFNLAESGLQPWFYCNGAVTDSAYTMLLGVPYFVAASSNAVSTNFIVVRLDTGQVVNQFSTASPGAFSGAFASYNCMNGSPSGVSFNMNGAVAAAMHAPAYLSPQQLLQWAQDPWAFWYPRTLEKFKFLGASTAANTNAIVTGQQLTASAGTIGFQIGGSITIAGLQLTSAAGSITEQRGGSVALAGLQLTTSIGTVTERVDDTTTLTGLQLSASAGTITETFSGNVSLSGLQLTSAAGSITFSTGSNASPSVTGLQLTSAAGSITERVDDTTTLTGLQLTASAGTVSPTTGNVINIPGLQLNTASGSITRTISSNITLTGQQLAAAAGTIAESVDDSASLTGLQLTTAFGNIVERTDDFATLLGLQLAAIAGNITTSGTSSPTIGTSGQQLATFAGAVFVNINNGGAFIRSEHFITADPVNRRITTDSINRRI